MIWAKMEGGGSRGVVTRKAIYYGMNECSEGGVLVWCEEFWMCSGLVRL
jgi:hypothetical protein